MDLSSLASAGDSAIYVIYLFGPALIILLAFWKCTEVGLSIFERVYNIAHGKPRQGAISSGSGKAKFKRNSKETSSDVDPAVPKGAAKTDCHDSDLIRIRTMQVTPSYIFLSGQGECYHTTTDCPGLLNARAQIVKNRACLVCTSKLEPLYNSAHEAVLPVQGQPMYSKRGEPPRSPSRGRLRHSSCSAESHRGSSTEVH